MESNFYCAKKCGDPNFSITEWNRLFKLCEDGEIVGEERDRLLHPELFPCKTQCDDCINIVLDTQAKNRLLLEKMGLG